MGGLEPPRITPHAPQTCTSTIPPHRLTVILLFNCQGFNCFMWSRGGSCFHNPLEKTFTGCFFSAECHIDSLSFYYLVVKVLTVSCGLVAEVVFTTLSKKHSPDVFFSAECHIDSLLFSYLIVKVLQQNCFYINHITKTSHVKCFLSKFI